MRLLQIVNTLDSIDGGPARNAFELNQALNSTPGVTALLCAVRGDAKASTAAADHAAGRTLLGPALRFHALRTSLLHIRRADTVIVHGYYLPWVPVVLLTARALRRRTIVMPHGGISTYEAARSKRRKKAFDTLLRLLRIDSPMFAVGSEQESIELRRIRPEANVAVVGVGARSLGDVSHRPVVDSERHLILTSVSRIARKKRIDLMVAAVKVLSTRGVDATLVVAGEGDETLRGELESQARSLEVDQHVRFVGHLSSAGKRDLYSRADVFLLPSEDENFGIGLAEALMSGVPAVVSARVAAAGAVSGSAVRIVPDPTAERLADAVEALRDTDEWQRAHVAATTEALSAYDWEAVAGRWLAICGPTQGSAASGDRAGQVDG